MTKHQHKLSTVGVPLSSPALVSIRPSQALLPLTLGGVEFHCLHSHSYRHTPV